MAPRSASPPVPSASLAARLHRAAAWYARRVAVADGDRELTFAELEDRSNRLANALVGLSAAGGDPAEGNGRVALLLPNSLEVVEADVAIAKAAKTKVPVNVRLSADEREYVLADSGAETLITDAAGLGSIGDAPSRLPELKTVIVRGDDGAGGTLRYADVLADASARRPGVYEDPAAPSVILYTSGTTGRPKGATASFSSRWLTTVSMLLEELDLRPGDGMVHAGSMAHGSGSKTFAFMLRGARNLPLAKFGAEQFFALVERTGATNTFLVPTMIETLVDAVEAGGPVPASLRTISYGGAPISERLLRRGLEALGPVFVQVYGSCEAPHPLAVLTKRDHAELTPERALSIGRECLGVHTALVDDQGVPVADGEPGEMLVGGDSIMKGYWRNPEATAEALRDGWYRTGDVARRDEDGYLTIVDRRREMIISGGLNIYPAEVERALLEHPGIAEAAVVGGPDDRWGEAVVALLVRAPGSDVDADAVVEHCRDRLAGYKKPKAVQFVDELPKGSTGKVLKRELRDQLWTGRDRMVN